MRRVLGAAAAVLCMVATGAPSVHAQGGRIAEIQAAGNLRVCIWPAYFAITFRNPRDDALEGIDIDLAKAFAADLGVRPVFVDTTFATFMDDLDANRCDVAMFGVGVTPARAARVAFSAPYLRSGVYAVTTKSQRRINTWDDIDQPGVVVAVQAGTFMEGLMRDSLKKAELSVVAPPRTREVEVESGRADVFMSDYPYTRRMVLTHDWARVISPPSPVAPTPYAYAVRSGDDSWLARVNAFVAAIRRDGRLLEAAKRHSLEPIVVD